MSRHKNRIDGQWSPRLIEMLESPAYRVLSVSAHRVISRIEIEHAHHGGNDNGNLPITKHDFMAYGMDHNAVAPAIREALLSFLGLALLRDGVRRRQGQSQGKHQPQNPCDRDTQPIDGVDSRHEETIRLVLDPGMAHLLGTSMDSEKIFIVARLVHRW